MKTSNRRRAWVACAVFVLALRAATAQVFVDLDATGANNGASWADAYTSLSQALQTAGPVEIWVAEGTYRPSGVNGDVTASFVLQDGQAVYGGFSGVETARSQRDPIAHPAILSGDLNGDDQPGFVNSDDNSYHVVTIQNAGGGTVLDGFIVTHGSAREASGPNSQGGGIVTENSFPAIAQCRFFDNFAHEGGAVMIVSGTVDFTGCIFQQNRVQNGRGGAIYSISGTTLTVDDSVFEENSATGNAGANDGGAVYLATNTTGTIRTSAFIRNSAESANQSIAATGGAISSLSDNLLVANCIFRDHTSNTGGAVYNSGDASYINCLFNGNRSIVGGANAADTGGFGGGMFNILATIQLIGCTFTNNTASEAAGVYNGLLGDVTITDCIFWQNSDAAGVTKNSQFKGIGTFTVSYSCVQNLLTPVAGEDPPNPADFPGSFDSNPAFVDLDGPDNVAGSYDDNLRLTSVSPCIDAGINAAFPGWVSTDLDGSPRYFDDPGTVDTGSGTPPIVDIGAYEFVTGSVTGSIAIDSGAMFAQTPNVSLSLSATGPGVTQMRFSDFGATWSAWEPYATGKAWVLDPTEGEKTVFVQYANSSAAVLAQAVDTIILDMAGPTGSIVINGDAPYTNSLSVTLTLSATDAGSAVSEMSFSNDGVLWSAWEAYGTSKAWTLPAGDGPKVVYVRYRDSLGNVSDASSDSIVADAGIPTGSVLVNGGATYTTTVLVSLTLSATDALSGVTQMRLSNDGVSWTAWAAYATTRAWGLSPGDGLKTVYVQYRDAAGNVSTTTSDSITLDTTPPTGSILINGGAAFTSSTSVVLNLTATDSGSGVASMRFSADGSTWDAWEPYAISKPWTLPGGDSVKTVYVQYRDGIGQISGILSDQITLDETAPAGSIVVDSGAAFTASVSVTLALSATDAGTGVSNARFSNDGAAWTAWEAYTTSRAWTVPAVDGLKTVYVQYRDSAGNVSASISDTITLDTLGPTGSILINGGAAATPTPSVTLTLDATDAGSGVTQNRLSNDGVTWGAWEAYTASKPWTLTAGDGLKTVYVQYRDALGHVSAIYSDDISLITTGPVGTVVVNSGASYTSSTAVDLTLSASGGTTPIVQMRFSNDNVGWTAWEPYGTARAWTLLVGDGPKTVFVEYGDAAGNVLVGAQGAIELDTTPPSGTIVIDSGAAYTSTTAVALALSATDGGSGISSMRFSNETATWTAWEPFAVSRMWTLTAGDGSKTVFVQFQDAAGNVSASFSDLIELDTVPPAGSISINGGAAFTSVPDVNLTLSATDGGSGVAQMRLSNDSVAWSAWEPYATTKPWTLPAGDGVKTLYVQYGDAVGNVSPAFADVITLNTVDPDGSVVINAGAAYTSSTAVALTLAASGGSTPVVQMRFSNDSAAWTAWEPYATTRAWNLAAGDGTKTVYVEYGDASGNVLATAQSSIDLDSTPPSGSVLIEDGAWASSTTAVTLALSANDAGAGVADMRLSTDGIAWQPWQPFAAALPWTLTSPDGLKSVLVQFRDPLGNESGSMSDDILLDTTPPTGSIVINSGVTSTTTVSATLSLTASDSLTSVAAMQCSNDGVHWNAWQPFATEMSWTLLNGDGPKTVFVRFKDEVGNVSVAYSDTITLSTGGTTAVRRWRIYR